MIDFLKQGLSTPAEIVCVVLTLLGCAAAQLSRRLGWGLAGLLLGWAALSATFREVRGPRGTGDLPLDEWAGWLASQHAGAMRVAFFGALGAALVVALTSERPDQPGPSDPLASRMLLTCALVLGAAAFGAPPVGLAALLALGMSLGAAQRGGVALAVAAGLLSLAALAGAESSLYKAAALFEPKDLGHLDARALGRAVSAVGAMLAAGAGLKMLWERRSGRGGLAMGALALLGLWQGLWGARTLSWGPVSLDTAALPVHRPALPARVVKGCVVSAGGEVEAKGGASCPERAPLPREIPAFFAGGAETPVQAMLSLVAGGAGEVGVLARMDNGWALPHWRVTAVPVVVRASPPDEPALRLLPEPIVADLREGRWVDGQGVPLYQAITRRSERTPRLDVLVPASRVATLGELLSACGEVHRSSRGARCVLGAGEIAQYAAPSPPREPIEIELEVIEVEE